MKILSLDLSTNTGWAILSHPKLVGFGRIEVKSDSFKVDYPFNYVLCAKKIADIISKIIEQYRPDAIVIEETNRTGKMVSRFSQKQLEFIHFAVIDMLESKKITPKYLDSRKWQLNVGATLLATDREHNKRLSDEKKRIKEEVRIRCKKAIDQQFQPIIDRCDTPLQAKEILGDTKKAFEDLFKSECRKIRIKDFNGVVGKITNKHVSIRVANELFGLRLIQQDNDIADAILLGVAFWNMSKKENVI